MSARAITGGCLCRAVRYRAPAEPLWVAHCHCESCRRSSGAPFVTWAGFPKEAVVWEGDAPKRFASSPGVARSFCATCGTPLAYEGERWPDEQHLLVANFDDPNAVTPARHVYWAEHLKWIEPGDDLPRHEGMSGEG